MANPLFIPIRFAMNGAKNVIQKVLQVGQDQEDATWNLGFPPVTMIPKEDGGLAPKGQDFNGIFYSLTDHIVHRQNGQQILFSQDVVDEYGGYALGSIVQSDDFLRHYRSLINNNTFDPNTTSIAGRWEIYAGSGSLPTASSATAGVLKVINTLTSSDTGSALSAAQGKVISDAFAGTKSSNGYQKILGGLIIQWGTVDYGSKPSEGDVSVTFPLEFPNACLNAQATRKVIASVGQNNDGGVNVISTTKTGLNVNLSEYTVSNSGLRGFTWLAIGY